MAGKKFSLRLCFKTEVILSDVPSDKRSAYVREAILFYHGQGLVLRRIEEKLDRLMAAGGKATPVPGASARAGEDREAETGMEAYLFSGQDDVFNM